MVVARRRRWNRRRTISSVAPNGDFLNGNFVAGAIVSGVARNIDSTFAPLLARHAGLVGHDLFWSSANREYDWRMQLALTNVSGDPREVLLRQSPVRATFSGRIAARGAADSSPGGSTRARRRCAVEVCTRDWRRKPARWFGELSLDTRTPGYESERLRVPDEKPTTSSLNANIGKS